MRKFAQQPDAFLVASGLVLLVAYLAAVLVFPRQPGGLLNGDAVHYYVYLRSVLFDGDLDFRNDYERLYAPRPVPRNLFTTSTGRMANVVSVGPAILWSPFVALVALVAGAGNWLGLWQVPMDGIATPYQVAAGVAGVIYATLGALLIRRIVESLFPGSLALWATAAAWFSTSALYYSLVSPAYSHATSMFAVASFTWAWLRRRGDLSFGRFAWLGFLGGLAGLVRWQDAVVLLLPLVEAVAAIRRDFGRLRAWALRLALLGVCFLVASAPQLLAWYALYGTPVLVPGLPGYVRWWSPRVGEFLFGHKHGLFSWTPAVAVAFLGLPRLIRRDPLVGWGSVLVIAAFVYVNASADPGAGEAFGARRFVGATVFVALGFAALAEALAEPLRRRLVPATVSFLVVANVLFLLQYQLYMRGFRDLVGYPTTAWEILGERFVLPLRLVHRLVRG